MSPRPSLTLVCVFCSSLPADIRAYILTLDAEKPEEWDDEEDGDWIAPTIRNPKCDEAPGCGEWKR
jgi:hypothetical protein